MNVHLKFAELTSDPKREAPPPLMVTNRPGVILCSAVLVLCGLFSPICQTLFRWADRGPDSAKGRVTIVVIALMVAALVSAACYIATWMTLGPERFGRRLPVGGVVLIGGCGLLLFGMWSVMPYRSIHFLGVLGFAMWIVLCFQAPLWMLRYLFRLRLTRPDSAPENERWSFRDWAVGSVILGAVLAALRQTMHSPGDTFVALALGGFGLMAALLLLPALWLLLSPRASRRRLAWIPLHAAIPLAPSVYAYVRGFARADEVPSMIFATLLLFAGFYAAAAVLRRDGYRLTRATAAGETEA